MVCAGAQVSLLVADPDGGMPWSGPAACPGVPWLVLVVQPSIKKDSLAAANFRRRFLLSSLHTYFTSPKPRAQFRSNACVLAHSMNEAKETKSCLL